MNDPTGNRWLLLIHQIPPKPDYFRVKIWRRLQRVGAVAVKNSVYVLPRGDQTLEDFQWIAREIAQGGGDASLCEAGFIEGLTDTQIESLFRAARDADYAVVADEARELTKQRRGGAAKNNGRAELEASVVRLRNRMTEIVAVDFFDALGRQTAEGLIASLERDLETNHPDARKSAARSATEFQKRVWVTRKGVHIDRIASAWMIRRFIDPHARFKFVPARGYQPQKGEIRFDMFDADFTHEGDRCTLEVLIARFAPSDVALRAVAEIVHDIDLKDAEFERPETAGIDAIITGLCTRSKDDDERLVHGAAIFDSLYESFSRRGR